MSYPKIDDINFQ